MTDWQILEGDCQDVLRTLPAQSVHTVVTSPPYYGLRDYGTGTWEGGDPACDHATAVTHTEPPILVRRSCRCGAVQRDQQLGLEATPDEYVAALVAVFGEVRRVLRDDGTVWLNLGDSYCSTAPGTVNAPERIAGTGGRNGERGEAQARARVDASPGMKPKDLIGIPWMVAFALRADGWYLRSDIIWSKPNPMPESVTDRPTKAHEYVFLLSKGPQYYYDADAIREDATPEGIAREGRARLTPAHSPPGTQPNRRESSNGAWLTHGRNKRSVWTIATQPYAGAHFATFPPKLIEPCVLAGCPARGVVLDPFCGAATTGLVAAQHGRNFIGIELSPEYATMARERIETFVRLGYRSPNGNGHIAPEQDSLFGELA